MARSATPTQTMRVLKQKVGFAISPSKADRDNSNADLYVKRPDGTFVAVEIKGQATVVGDDYVYVSVMRPISILAKIDGDRAKTITDEDVKAVKLAETELSDIINKPKAPRVSSKPTVPAEFAAALEAAKSKIEVPAGYTLAFDKSGTPVYKKARVSKTA